LERTKEQVGRVWLILRAPGNARAVIIADSEKWGRKKALTKVAGRLNIPPEELFDFLESGSFALLCAEISEHWPHLLK